MRRATPTLPVTPAMLRHFAVLTGAATLCVAMFATGENSTPKIVTAKAPDHEGGGMGSIFGAEERALKGNHPEKPAKVVNGMKIASGTRIEPGGGSADVGEPDRQEGGSQGDIRNYFAQKDQPVNGFTPPPAPGNPAAAMAKDTGGIPAPAANAAISRRPAGATHQAPRQATPADYERMMAESQRRAGPNSADE